MTAKEHIEAAKQDGIELIEVIDPKESKELDDEVAVAFTVLLGKKGVRVVGGTVPVKHERSPSSGEIRAACHEIVDGLIFSQVINSLQAAAKVEQAKSKLIVPRK